MCSHRVPTRPGPAVHSGTPFAHKLPATKNNGKSWQPLLSLCSWYKVSDVHKDGFTFFFSPFTFLPHFFFPSQELAFNVRLTMHFTLLFISSLFVLTPFVHSAPTASLDPATLLNNALEAQQLNAQFRDSNSTATGSCTSKPHSSTSQEAAKSFVFFLFFSFLFYALDGDTTCVQGAIASCVNGQFDTSKGRCPATQKCFALPSLTSNGTVSQTPINFF